MRKLLILTFLFGTLVLVHGQLADIQLDDQDIPFHRSGIRQNDFSSANDQLKSTFSLAHDVGSKKKRGISTPLTP